MRTIDGYENWTDHGDDYQDGEEHMDEEVWVDDRAGGPHEFRTSPWEQRHESAQPHRSGRAPAASRLIDVLSYSEAVPAEHVRTFVSKLGGDADTTIEEFKLFVARGIAAVLRGPATDATISQ